MTAEADARQQLQRVLDESDRPADAAAEKALEPATPGDRTRQWMGTNFARMRMSWIGDDAIQLGEIHATAEKAIKARFGRALRLIDQLQEIAQIPLVHESGPQTGEVRTYPNGTRMVRLDDRGDPVEDWSRLTSRQRSDFLHIITVHLHEWETAKDDLWGEAMYAKVAWEMQFAKGFITLPGQAISGKPTIDDRTQTGHAFSGQERYFAVFCSVLSRKADSLVRSIVRIQRLLENLATS